MEKSKTSSIVKRIVTALVLVPVTVGVLYAGYPYVQVMALVFGGMMAWEWSNMVPNKGNGTYGIVYALAVAAAIFATSPWAVAAVVAGSAVLVWIKARGEVRRHLLTLGVLYISIGIGSLVWLYGQVGFLDTMWFLLMVWGVDTGGYVVGSTVKGPKLAPKISPNKTWSGLIGGILFSVLASTAVCWYVGAQNHLLFYNVLAAGIAVIAQIGDLVESKIKRSLNMKDSSDLIPGHGGVFDRIDGLIFSAPFVYVMFRYVLFLI